MPGSHRYTFIEVARRAQIIDCAINAVADLGYSHASLAQIGKRAQISKGVITYHFANKEELMNEALKNVLVNFTNFVKPRVEAESGAAAKLRAFLEANVAFMGKQRKQLVALQEIAANVGAGRKLAAIASSDIAKLSNLFQQGQLEGEFRLFDTKVMAVAILSLRNGVLRQLVVDPGLDLDTYGRELVALVELATRRT